VTYTAIVVVFLVTCVAAGTIGGTRVARPRMAVALAAVMVVTQLVLLIGR